ncbi:MAG: hypothetical protein QXF52_02525 [Thermoproteota archaeon]
MTEINHILKLWEKRYGYLRLSKKQCEFFSSVIDKCFTLKILERELYGRKIDDQKRIWVSPAALNDLEVGDVLVIGRDKKGNYYIKKKE